MAARPARAEAAPATGLLAKYPLPITADAAAAKNRTIDLFNAQKALLATMRDVSGEKRAAPSAAAAVPEDPLQKAQAERAEVARGLAKCYAYTSQHVPGGVVMQKVSSITFITSNGLKTISRDAVEATLRDARRPYITDLLEGSSVDPTTRSGADGAAAADDGSDSEDDAATTSKYMRVDAVEVLRGFSYKELDEMRFALVAMAELISKQIYDEDGRLTGLAKRDMKRHYAAEEEAARKERERLEEAASNKGGAAAAAPAAAGAAAAGEKPQKNLKPLLLDQCMSKWPHTPPDKAAAFTMEQDPNRPRHKPLYRATVNLTVVKRKFEGEWMPTKRDAENAVSELALAFLMHMKPK